MLFVLGGACVLGTAGTARGFSGGIPSTAFGSAGCNQVACHSGGMAPEVRLSGPLAVEPLSTHEYTFEIVTPPGQPFGGLNVRADGGTLARGRDAQRSDSYPDRRRRAHGGDPRHAEACRGRRRSLQFPLDGTCERRPFSFHGLGKCRQWKPEQQRRPRGHDDARGRSRRAEPDADPEPVADSHGTADSDSLPECYRHFVADAFADEFPHACRPPDARWDANCDGEVSAADLLAWVKILGGVDPACPADPDCDGRAGEEDLSALVRVVFDAVLAGTPCPLAAM
ncbi:MAG: hypothetical protein KatS3mg076_0526 [Candidatus Binatia bacterium]|nr:MAG: hypothetical protein KatS3mg076_0526 [Candidatus Binatia bacterium]